jgi:hypothetical protein
MTPGGPGARNEEAADAFAFAGGRASSRCGDDRGGARPGNERVSTKTNRPKWASVYWRPGPQKCEPFARDGVAVLKLKKGRWRFVTAGSDFDCPRLYRDVPRRVAKDLDLPCH